MAIEAGEMTYTLLKGAAAVTHADATREEVDLGRSVTLRVGDSLYYDRETAHTAGNEGNREPVVVLAVTLLAVRSTRIDSDRRR